MPNEWKPQIVKFALAMRVLVVAKTRIEGAWSAYCDAVPGIDHREEMAEVLRVGTKLPESIARAIYPEFDDLPYAP